MLKAVRVFQSEEFQNSNFATMNKPSSVEMIGNG